MAPLFFLLCGCLLMTLVIGERAPHVLSTDVPDVALWCDKELGTPTRTTGECICKYDCDGPGCTRSQGFKFFGWKDGMRGAKCLPAVVKTEAEKENARTSRRLENERITRARKSATMNDPSLEEEATSQPVGHLESLGQRWRELVEDLEWPNLVVAVVVSALFGTVLVAMVVMNLKGVREDMQAPRKQDAAISDSVPPKKAGKKDD